MEGNRIRDLFLSFFEERGHTRVRSSSLIAPPETGLLLTSAGMNQFIPYFLGQTEAPYPRATTAQKVMRTNDIENVGQDARHLTFFEMLGNFSFGDYFKKEAIRWAHELVTEGYGIDHDLLWVTVYESDEARDARDRIVHAGCDAGVGLLDRRQDGCGQRRDSRRQAEREDEDRGQDLAEIRR